MGRGPSWYGSKRPEPHVSRIALSFFSTANHPRLVDACGCLPALVAPPVETAWGPNERVGHRNCGMRIVSTSGVQLQTGNLSASMSQNARSVSKQLPSTHGLLLQGRRKAFEDVDCPHCHAFTGAVIGR